MVLHSVEAPYLCVYVQTRPTSTDACLDAPGPPRAGGRPVAGAARAADDGRASRRLRGLLPRRPGALDDPYERLRRTGDRAGRDHLGPAADGRPAHRAGARHAQRASAGRSRATPAGSRAGTPYAADDPELLLWILACLVDSAAAGLRALRRARSTDAERDAYWQDYRRASASCFGLRQDATCRATSTAFDAYIAGDAGLGRPRA